VRVLRAPFPFNGEDFAYFLDRVPGAMFILGVANPAAGLSGIVHTPTFAADERAIALGTRVMAGWLATRLTALDNDQEHWNGVRR
jgi:metal-dependent amidase/aminoacylase/carboxypeptidase family protein